MAPENYTSSHSCRESPPPLALTHLHPPSSLSLPQQLLPRCLLRDFPKILSCKVAKLQTQPLPKKGGGGGSEIVTAFCPYKPQGGGIAKITMLYSHGNAVDLGQMLPVFR